MAYQNSKPCKLSSDGLYINMIFFINDEKISINVLISDIFHHSDN